MVGVVRVRFLVPRRDPAFRRQAVDVLREGSAALDRRGKPCGVAAKHRLSRSAFEANAQRFRCLVDDVREEGRLSLEAEVVVAVQDAGAVRVFHDGEQINQHRRRVNRSAYVLPQEADPT